jgi:succinoglycan biosynthesis protein ExoM
MFQQRRRYNNLCSVCIASYRRPGLLKKLLISLEMQLLPKGLEMEVIVVDNDPQKSAEPIVHKFQNSSRFYIYYFNQPIKNISITRNLGVEKSSGEYILFIDDDEVASPQWVESLLRTLVTFEADGVFGPVLAEFNALTPEWMRYIIPNPVSRTGAKATSKWTGNCIIKSSLLKKMNEPFDRKYGTTGGEDTHLFDRLEQDGARFVYSKEAWVSEYWPTSRTSLSYLFLRGLKGGNIHTRRIIEFAGKKRILVKPLMFIKAVSLGIISLLLMVIFCLSEARRTYWLIKLGSNIGRFLAAFSWHYQYYR